MYTSDTFRILAYSELYLFRYISTYSRIFRIAYWEFRSIPAYSAPFVTLAYSQPYHIPSQGVFRTGDVFRTVYSGIIQSYSGISRTLCNAYLCRNLIYSESWNFQNPSIISSRRIFKTVLFTKIGKPCLTQEIQNPDILTILEY